jgi:maltooligosyltrehalose trehalohydrolase
LPINVLASRFIAYLQNHDQLGNRALGDRLCHLVNQERMRMGAALLLLSPYVPLLFQGEEWAATSPFQYFVDFREEPELAKAVAAGRCAEFASFGWRPEDLPDPNSPDTFERSKLHWDELEQPPHTSMLQWHRMLIDLRRRLSPFTTARLDLVHVDCSEEAQWLRVERGPMTILCNFGQQPCRVPIRPGSEYYPLLTTKPIEICSEHVLLPQEAFALLGPHAASLGEPLDGQ